MDNENRTNINWFPGHMAKTRRIISENLKKVDIVLEICDARIPDSSQNPEIKKILGDKKKIIILNKSDLADGKKITAFSEKLSESGVICIPIDSKSGKGIEKIKPAAEKLLSDKIKRDAEKGMTRAIRAMVVGIPNVGKSTLINRLVGKNAAKTENRPGVTVSPQWFKTVIGLELLDMPGILWPKFNDKYAAENLAITGAIKNQILDIEEMAVVLCKRLSENYPELLISRYGISKEDTTLSPYEIFTCIGKKRGMLQKGGEINEERCALMLIDELRSGVIGKITLDRI